MNRRLVTLSITLVDPDNAGAVGDNECYIPVPFNCTLVHVTGSVGTDDAGADLDVLDDGVEIITALDIADKEAPGEWASVHTGGSNAPIEIAAGSEISFDVNDIEAAVVVYVVLWVLVGEVTG
jgi:hypothetical protein